MSPIGEGSPIFLCVGDIDVDVLIRVDRLPTHDGKVNGVLEQRTPGGMAGNVAVALGRLGAKVRILGRVGDDDNATFAAEALSNAGIDTRFVTRLSGITTFSCISLLTPGGEKSLIKLMTPAYRPGAEDLTDAVWKGVSHIHLTSVGDLPLCRRVVEAARHAGGSASLDIERADCPDSAADLLEALDGFDLVFSNSEARAFVDGVLGRSLAGLVPEVVATLGARGAEVETGGSRIFSPGLAVDVIDTTGAGDCFASACLYARLIERLDWSKALRFANTAAAISTTRLGAQSGLPTAADIWSRMSSAGARGE